MSYRFSLPVFGQLDPYAGLCDHCGACCMHMGVPPVLHEDEQTMPPELLAKINSAVDGGRDLEGPCLWLTPDGKCKHYDHRPVVCRDYEPGSKPCRVARHVWRKSDEGERETTLTWLESYYDESPDARYYAGQRVSP